LSSGIDAEAFQCAHLVQPDLFIRAQGENIQDIADSLTEAGLEYVKFEERTFALPNATKLDVLLPDSLNYRVQDLSSQRTGHFMEPAKYEYWWDCCAASGGKSILLAEKEKTIQLLVSDVRESILQNLDERFRKAGIQKYQKKIIDLLQNNDQILHHYEFDGIVLDAPCTGSGTWGRTPEMLSYFDEHRIGFFSKLQFSIAENIVKYLKPGKPLIYITCSVFKEENEELVAKLTDTLPLKLDKMEVIKGYDDKADTMFVARLIKEL
ncbi:MAG: RsmB/NOP family class I SAM-dependent RNA methyltransferase, partial [Pedobacter sp.]